MTPRPLTPPLSPEATGRGEPTERGARRSADSSNPRSPARRDRACAGQLLREGRPEFRETAVDAAPAAAAGEIRRRPAARHQVRVRAEGRPAAGDRRAGRGRQARTTAPRCCSASPARARPSPWRKVIEATQRPALILAPNKTLAAQLYGEFKSFFPDNAVEYFVSLLRLLPAGSLCPAHRHLYREGILDQRADRPHAPLGDARAARARRRHHRRLGVVHLRHRLGRDLFGDDLRAQAAASASTSAS